MNKNVINRLCDIRLKNYNILNIAINELISEKKLSSERNNLNVNMLFHNKNKKIDFHRNTECGCKYCSIGREYALLMICKHRLSRIINNGDILFIDEDNIKNKIEDINIKIILTKKRLEFFKNLLNL